jgi:hypothetical protein
MVQCIYGIAILAVGTANINSNVIRSHSRTTTTGTFIGISSTGAVTTALNINNNQLGMLVVD